MTEFIFIPAAWTTTTSGRDDVVRPFGVDPAHIMIVEDDDDCADALQVLLTGLPGVGSIQMVETPAAALDIAARSEPDVIGFTGTARPRPDIVFVDDCLGRDGSAMLAETLSGLRQRLPEASIVLLSVYPDRQPEHVRALAHRSIRKDTSQRELGTLLVELRGRRALPADELAS